jgi:MSHA biogenesis protein MshE
MAMELRPTRARRKGCNHCNNTGYHGRQAHLRTARSRCRSRLPAESGRRQRLPLTAQQRLVGQTLRDEALRLVRGGITSVAEAMRVTHQVDE